MYCAFGGIQHVSHGWQSCGYDLNLVSFCCVLLIVCGFVVCACLRDMCQTLISILGLIALALTLARVLRRPSLAAFIASNAHQGVLVLGLVALCLCMALVTGTLGLSLEMGAFLAGLTVRWGVLYFFSFLFFFFHFAFFSPPRVTPFHSFP